MSAELRRDSAPDVVSQIVRNLEDDPQYVVVTDEASDVAEVSVLTDAPEVPIDGSSPESSKDDLVEMMKSELISSKATLHSQGLELTRLRARCLALENELGSDKGKMLSEITTTINSCITSGFQSL